MPFLLPSVLNEPDSFLGRGGGGGLVMGTGLSKGATLGGSGGCGLELSGRGAGFG